MTQQLGLWTLELGSSLDHILVTSEDLEIFELYREGVEWNPRSVYSCAPTIKENHHIFAWYIQSKVLSKSDLMIHTDTINSASTYIVELLESFIHSLRCLNVVKCNEIIAECNTIDFSRFYLYKTKWLLSELSNIAHIFHIVLIGESCVAPLTLDCKTWWEQPFVMKQKIDTSRSTVDFENLKKISALSDILQVFDRISKLAGEWGGCHNKIDRHEPAAGLLMALAKHWLSIGSTSIALLSAHRSIDLMMIFLLLKHGLIIPTVKGLVYSSDMMKYAKFERNCRTLADARIITLSEKYLFEKLNNTRNNLREVHGFYVVGQSETERMIFELEKVLKRLASETKVWSIQDKFTLNLDLDISIFFDAETDFDSYLKNETV
jgi:hypothetical protein